MQRHFSNRGEALPEVTARRAGTNRKGPTHPQGRAKGWRQLRPEQWFLHTAQRTPQAKAKPARAGHGS